MKNWKKRWIKELDRDVPKLSSNVLNAQVETASDNCQEKTKISFNQLIGRFFSSPLRVCASVLVVCLLSIVLLTTIVSPAGRSDKIYPYAFVVEINPAVALTTDEDGNVTALSALNQDADVVLSKMAEEDWEKKPLAEVVAFYTDLAAKLGFIDISSETAAMRITANKAENVKKLLDATRGKLEDYFLERGVFGVVLCEAVEKDKFSERLGIDAQTNEQFIESIKSKFTYTFEADVQGANLETIQNLYRENVLDGDFVQWLNDCIENNLLEAEKNVAALEKMVELNDKIKAHQDNPSYFEWNKDYWTVKEADDISASLKKLLDEMTAAIKDYGQKWSVKIDSEEALVALKISCAESYRIFKYAFETVKEFVAENFEEFFSAISGVLQECGILSSEDLALAEIPQTVEEYTKKALEMAANKAELRAEKFEESYNLIHNPISQDAYDDYIEDLIKKYGTLSDYWQAYSSGNAE